MKKINIIREQAKEIYRNNARRQGGEGRGSGADGWAATFEYIQSNGQTNFVTTKTTTREGKPSLLKKIENLLIEIERRKK